MLETSCLTNEGNSKFPAFSCRSWLLSQVSGQEPDAPPSETPDLSLDCLGDWIRRIFPAVGGLTLGSPGRVVELRPCLLPFLLSSEAPVVPVPGRYEYLETG